METTTFLSLLLKSSVALLVVWTIWFISLRRINRFSLVRTFLLMGSVLAVLSPMIAPLLATSLTQSVASITLPFSISIPEVQVNQTVASNGVNWMVIIMSIYVMVSLLFLIRFLIQLVKIFSLVITGNHIDVKGVTVVNHGKNLPPFSFLGYCFLNPNDIPSDKMDVIIGHESAHTRRYHSADIILLEIIGVFQWFNPFYWLIRKALVELHEYQADEVVLKSNPNQQTYMDSIVSLAFSGIALSLGNNFNKSLTLKRLAMMNTKKVGKIAIPTLVLSFVMAVGIILTISCSKSMEIQAQDETVVTAKNLSATDQTKDDRVFVVVEEMPVFDNDDTKEFVKFRQYLAKNLRYPEEAAKKGIQGRVFVSFVVDAEGNVTKVKVEKGVEPALDNEAVRVIQSSPKWHPGKQSGENVNVSFTFPIVFSLQ